MRIRQRRQREAKGGMAARTPAARAARGELGIHLNAGAEQQQVTLEVTETEACRPVDRSPLAQAVRRAPSRTLSLAACASSPRELRLQARELGDQKTLVGFGPIAVDVAFI